MTNTIATPGLVVADDFGAHLRARSPLEFRHTFADLPLFSLESVAELAEALPAESVVHEAAKKPLAASEFAPQFSPPDVAGDLVRTIDENDSWLTLLNIEQIPRYRDFIDAEIDALALRIGESSTALHRRMGFVFVSSPGSVTPAHFDLEHSLMLQLRGNRSLTFGTFATEDEREHEIGRFWAGSFGRMEAVPNTNFEIAVEPGTAIYIPPFTPHWLNNGDASSLSLTVTFFNRDNETETMARAFNERLHRLHVPTRRYGVSPRTDRSKAALMTKLTAAKRKLRGAPERSAGR